MCYANYNFNSQVAVCAHIPGSCRQLLGIQGKHMVHVQIVLGLQMRAGVSLLPKNASFSVEQ